MTKPEHTYTDREIDKLTTLFTVLSNTRRIRTIQALRGEQSINRQELTNRVTQLTHPDKPTSDSDLNNIYTGLYHIHLPKLDDHSVIVWDQTTDTIYPGPHYETALTILDDVTNTI